MRADSPDKELLALSVSFSPGREASEVPTMRRLQDLTDALPAEQEAFRQEVTLCLPVHRASQTAMTNDTICDSSSTESRRSTTMPSTLRDSRSGKCTYGTLACEAIPAGRAMAKPCLSRSSRR